MSSKQFRFYGSKIGQSRGPKMKATLLTFFPLFHATSRNLTCQKRKCRMKFHRLYWLSLRKGSFLQNISFWHFIKLVKLHFKRSTYELSFKQSRGKLFLTKFENLHFIEMYFSAILEILICLTIPPKEGFEIFFPNVPFEEWCTLGSTIGKELCTANFCFDRRSF